MTKVRDSRRRRRRQAQGSTAFFGVAVLVVGLFDPGPLLGGILGPGNTTTWTTVWEDTFDGAAGSPPSATNWRYDLGRGLPGGPVGWGNNELQSYTSNPANVALDGSGRLRITASRSAAGDWTSARIQTRRADFAPTPGRSLKIEATIALPGGGQGYWPAFWALGAPFRTNPGAWPSMGEIDVMENINNSAAITGALHCGTRPAGPCNEPSGRSGQSSVLLPAGFAGTHLYSVVWESTPARLSYQLDGNTYFQITPEVVGQATWDAATSHGYFLLLNIAVGGTYPGPPNSGTAPTTSMYVEQVRVSTS